MRPKINKWIIAAIATFVLVAVLLILVPLLRGHPLIYGSSSYNELLNAKSCTGLCNPYQMLLGLMIDQVPLENLIVIIHVLFGLVSALGLWLFVYQRIKIKKMAFFTLLSFILLPGFIVGFSTPSKAALAIPLIIWAVYLLTDKKLMYYGLPLLAIAMAIRPVYAIAGAIFLLSKKENPIWIKTGSVLWAILSIGWINPIHGVYSFEQVIKTVIFDFGALGGISLVHLILAVVGIVLIGKKSTVLLLTFLSAVVLQFFMLGVSGILLIVTAVYSGYTITKLFEKKWILPLLRITTLIIAIVGLLIPAGVTLVQSRENLPNETLNSALGVLAEYEGNIVLSAAEYSSYIKWKAEKQPLISPETSTLLLKNQTQEIFSSRNLKKTKSLLELNKVDYILITEEMRQGLIWKEEGEGLLFLLRNNETFKRIHQVSDVEIWEVLW